MKAVSEALGDVPELRCEEGREVPLTQSGRVVSDSEYTSFIDEHVEIEPGGKAELFECDSPALGNLGDVDRCAPHSRLLVATRKHRGMSIRWVMICTKTGHAGDVSSTNWYELVNVIGYNETTGVTGFFSLDSANDTSGVTFPGLVAGSNDAQIKNFLDRVNVASNSSLDHCVNCHNGGPFRKTKFIQGFDENEKEPFVPRAVLSYVKNYRPIGWDGRKGRATDGDETERTWAPSRLRKEIAPTCTSCHIVQGGSEEEEFVKHAWVAGHTIPNSGWHIKLLAEKYPAMAKKTDVLAKELQAILDCLKRPEDDTCWERDWAAPSNAATSASCAPSP